ncbi:GTPase Era [Candidiatus Paracoxiella cheracis]|uniref:GTPase Era n=1 Tax=Candidiatus Paracoxiella cheracis TaxID=3405120 RepID=UPI003BF50301
MNKPTHCGYVAIIGRPNVGKSTLLNRMLGQKISITSRKPQTTRQRILGVKTTGDVQIVFLDTPGLHPGIKRAINQYMNREARAALHDMDVILFVVDGEHWDEQDEWVLKQLQSTQSPVILVLNKIDQVKDRSKLLPYIEKVSQAFKFYKIIPVSAKTGEQVETLEKEITACLPESPFYFPPDQITDRSEQFMAQEIIREKLMRGLGQELPYALTVTIVALKKEEKIIRISAVIWVEKDSQKGIVIGKEGSRLKKIGQQSRLDMEKFFGQKVYLQLWVKVKSGWSDSERLLKELGFGE